MRRRATLVLFASMWLLVPVSTARAQSSSSTDVPDRFKIDAGGFEMFVSTVATFGSQNLGGSSIDFEHEVNLPDTATRGYVEGTWRIAKRHQLSVNFVRVYRTGPGTTLTRDINWGGAVYPAGFSTVASMGSNFLAGVYRIAAYRNPQFEVGPAIGFGYLSLTAGLDATGTITGPQGTLLSKTISHEAKETTPTADIGGYANWWLARRVYARGDFRYIAVKPSDSEASITEGRAAIEWYPWQHFGVGAQYDYTKFRYDRGVLVTQLGGKYRYDGVQLLLSAAF